MDKDGESTEDNDEQNVRTSLESLAEMASGLSRPSDQMEIIGIAAPEDADELDQLTSDDSVVPLPDKSSSI